MLWIRIYIGFVCNSFVDPDLYSEHGSGSTQLKTGKRLSVIINWIHNTEGQVLPDKNTQDKVTSTIPFPNEIKKTSLQSYIHQLSLVATPIPIKLLSALL